MTECSRRHRRRRDGLREETTHRCRRGRGCHAKDVKFSGTGPGVPIHFRQGDEAHKAAGFGREAHSFLASVGGERTSRHSSAPGDAIVTDIELVASDGAVGATILAGQIAKAIDLIASPQIEHQAMGRGGRRWDHSVCQKVAELPSRTFVAAPFSPISSWLSAETTRNCCRGMRALVGVETTAVLKMLSSAALVQGLPFISDKATRRTKRPVLAVKRTVFSLVLAASVPAATAVPQVTPSSLT